MWTGRECEGGANWEIGMDIYTTPCVTQPVGICCKAQEAKLGLRYDLDGRTWRGAGEGGRAKWEGIHVYL